MLGSHTQNHRKRGVDDAADHAVVIGGGFAGLLAARVLADRFRRVTVLEREAEPAAEDRVDTARIGHARMLLAAGEQILEELFPGIFAELEGRGARSFDFGEQVRWHQHGVWKAPCHSGLDVHVQSRHLLEDALRRRLSRWQAVEIRYETEVTRLLFGAGGAEVRGVRLAAGSGQRQETLAADLVVDAGGRSSAVPRWLREAGLGRVPEKRHFVNLKLSSRLFRARSDLDLGCEALLIGQDPPRQKRLGVLLPIEGGRWLVTLGGYAGDHPPVDGGDFLDFARGLARPELYEAIRDAEPASEVWQQRFPYALSRSYAAMRRLPRGLAVVGEGLASFDPVMGPGLALAARGARLLGEHLRTAPARGELRAYFRALEREIAAAWALASGELSPFSQALAADRPPWLGVLHRYLRALGQLSATDPAVHGRFLRVLHLLQRPVRLLHPRILGPVMGRLLKRSDRGLPRRAAPTAPTLG